MRGALAALVSRFGSTMGTAISMLLAATLGPLYQALAPTVPSGGVTKVGLPTAGGTLSKFRVTPAAFVIVLPTASTALTASGRGVSRAAGGSAMASVRRQRPEDRGPPLRP